MQDHRGQDYRGNNEALQQLCKALHQETGVYLRISNNDDWSSLASLIKLSQSARLRNEFERLAPLAFQS